LIGLARDGWKRIRQKDRGYPRVGFIVTNMARRAENVVAFYNKRGTCEQWIKKGKGAISSAMTS
jgi:hypothetical protein